MTVRPIEPLSGPPEATIALPGSKSITNRALLIAGLAEGESQLRRALFADDTAAMLGCLAELGVATDADESSRTIMVRGLGNTFPEGPRALHAHQSGVTGRFVAAATLAGRGTYEVDGHDQLRARPMADLVTAMEALGAQVESADGALPLKVRVERVQGGQVTVGAGTSSQFASGLLIVAPLLPEGLTLVLEGEVVSRPYLEMTAMVMRQFGAVVESTASGYRVEPGRYEGRLYEIEPDATAASYFFGAAAVTGGTVRIEGFRPPVLQGDLAFVDLLERMGARVEQDDHGVTVTGGPLRGIDADLSSMSDTVPSLAVVASTAEGPTTISGVGFIRHKESDRIAATVNELRRAGVDADELDDGLTVHPGRHRRVTIDTYDDHRIAMAFSLLGLVEPGIDIAEPECVAKTFPDFFEELDRLRPAETTTEPSFTVVAIDGPAGSGKSTVARAVADRLGLQYLDTGAMYRAVTFAAICRHIDPDDVEGVADVARDAEIDVGPDGVRVDGVDATTEIRGPEVTRAVSAVAANPAVRRELRSRQREWAHRRGGGVMEGRDIGTVVFPDAALKVYLTASAEVRARRRAEEVTDLDYETVAADIARRDALDQGRDDSPLVEADDAFVIDTSDLTIEQVVDVVEEALR